MARFYVFKKRHQIAYIVEGNHNDVSFFGFKNGQFNEEKPKIDEQSFSDIEALSDGFFKGQIREGSVDRLRKIDPEKEIEYLNRSVQRPRDHKSLLTYKKSMEFRFPMTEYSVNRATKIREGIIALARLP